MYTFSVDISLDVIIMFEINSCVARVKKFSVDILSTCGCVHNCTTHANPVYTYLKTQF